MPSTASPDHRRIAIGVSPQNPSREGKHSLFECICHIIWGVFCNCVQIKSMFWRFPFFCQRRVFLPSCKVMLKLHSGISGSHVSSFSKLCQKCWDPIKIINPDLFNTHHLIFPWFFLDYCAMVWSRPTTPYSGQQATSVHIHRVFQFIIIIFFCRNICHLVVHNCS